MGNTLFQQQHRRRMYTWTSKEACNRTSCELYCVNKQRQCRVYDTEESYCSDSLLGCVWHFN